MGKLIQVAYFLAVVFVHMSARASTYECNGKKDLTKGEVVRTLMQTPKAKCFKTDAIILDERKMTLKNAPKD